MNKAIIATLSIVTVIIIIVVGLVAYSYTQIHVSLNNVKFDSIDWAPISLEMFLKLGLSVLTGNLLETAFELIQGINLNLMFDLSNFGFIPVYIPDLSYDLVINDISLGIGYGNIDIIIYPGETKEIPILQNFQKNNLTPAVKSIINSGGVIKLHVSGTAYFKLLGMNIPIPFESTKQISLVDEINYHLNNEIQENTLQSDLNISLDDSINQAMETIKNKIKGNK
jgi:LEA14-like dessication related protein